MTFEELKSARESYAYIPARLERISNKNSAKLTWKSLNLDVNVPMNWQKGGFDVRREYSSVQLDTFHHNLLDDDDEENMIHGLLSVVFWGFASGIEGRVNVEFALAKSRALIQGRGKVSAQKPSAILTHLRRARELLKSSRIGDAVQEAQKIQFLGMAFASKIAMFMNPSIAAVYDNVISNRLRLQIDPQLRALYVPTLWTRSNSANAKRCNVYERWCHWCLEKANALNRAAFKWKDWNGIEYDWRAVDVERALFALGRQ